MSGMNEAQALARPSSSTNNAAFIAAHVTDARFALLRVLGVDIVSPLARALDGAKSIDDLTEMPLRSDVEDAWTLAARALRDRLETITAEELAAQSSTTLPLLDKSVLAVATFLVHHDTYHVGQLSLLRKYVGLPAMAYT